MHSALVRFALGPVAGDDALAMMRLSLFDWAACGLAGRSEPVAQILRDMVRDTVLSIKRSCPASRALARIAIKSEHCCPSTSMT